MLDDSLRRTDLRIRHTTYGGIVVDERVLTRSFPSVRAAGRIEVFVPLSGSVVLHHPDPIVIPPGEAWLLPRSAQSMMRFEDASFFEIDWPSTEAIAPRRLSANASALVAAAARLKDVGHDGDGQHAYLTSLLEHVNELGVSMPDEMQYLEGGPTPRDLRLAEALASQLANIREEATVIHWKEEAAVSARQLQRLMEDFNARYGFNTGNWRDTRTRWRVQFAAVLLGIPSLSVAEVADEVGFSSATALARAFARWKLDPPSVIRNAFATR